MTSPLHVFRKYQYLFLVAFGIMLMFAFVIAPPLDDYLRSRAGVGGGGGDTAVNWKYGAVSEAEMSNLRSRHLLTIRFLRALMSRVELQEAVPVEFNGQTVTLIKGRSYPVVREGFGEAGERTFEIVVEGQLVEVPQTAARLVMPRVPLISAANDEEQLFRKVLLERKADEMGVVISDEAIIEYFDNLADTTAARRPNYDLILADSTNGRLTEPELMSQMRMELMAQRAQMMAQAGLYSAPPESLFEYYNRLNRRVTVELLPVNVASLTGEVQDPTEAEIKALYETGKNRFPMPTLPEPGFKQRKKIAFAYFQGVMEDFVQKEMAVIEPTITEEAIAAYYEQNKETEFKIPELPSAEDEAGESTPEGGAAEETMPETAAESEKTDADPGTEGAAGTDDKSTEPPAKQDAPKQEDPSKQDPAQDEPKKDEPKKDEPKKDEPKKESDDQTGKDDSGDETDQAVRRPSDNKVVFVSYTQDTTDSPPQQDPPELDPPELDPPKQDPPKQDPPKQDPPKEDPPKEDPPKEDPPKEDPPKGEQQEMTTDATAEGQDATQTQEKAEGDTSAGEGTEEKKEAKYRPLDEVRDTIRERLTRTQARPIAQEKMSKALETVRGSVDRYGRELARSKVLEQSQAPQQLDYEALAQEHGLTYHKTPLFDIVQMAEASRSEEADGDPDYYKFARATQMSFDPRQGLVRRSILDVGFTGDLNPFSPRRLVDGFVSDDSFPTAPEAVYIYWRAEEVAETVPELKDIRDEVVQAWKKQKAFPLAVKEAENKAQKASEQADKSLAEVFPDVAGQVIVTNEFSWMTRGSMPSGAGARPTLSAVNGMQQEQPVNVPGAGRDFMTSVFSLPVGGTGTAANQPKTTVYVARVASESLSEEQRRELFFASGMTPDVEALMQNDQVDVIGKWYRDLDKEYKVSWKSDPTRSWDVQ